MLPLFVFSQTFYGVTQTEAAKECYQLPQFNTNVFKDVEH